MYSKNEIVKLVELIAETVEPSKIILFGSYAYGTPCEKSDIDLLVLLSGKSLTMEDRAKLATKVYYKRKEVGMRTRYDAAYVAEEDVVEAIQRECATKDAIEKGRLVYVR
ncbi:MAG: nucleotidyltransferase domain-containing protein [Oscillospiraceae bacterium]|nr:nucleotidyltransferase domain-containing protein [Oscillospiraceae bacterium]MCL2279877.1 nucleotidyltransferase domain-containing protein [Oscillospiraceae bacterium]